MLILSVKFSLLFSWTNPLLGGSSSISPSPKSRQAQSPVSQKCPPLSHRHRDTKPKYPRDGAPVVTVLRRLWRRHFPQQFKNFLPVFCSQGRGAWNHDPGSDVSHLQGSCQQMVFDPGIPRNLTLLLVEQAATFNQLVSHQFTVLDFGLAF